MTLWTFRVLRALPSLSPGVKKHNTSNSRCAQKPLTSDQVLFVLFLRKRSRHSLFRVVQTTPKWLLFRLNFIDATYSTAPDRQAQASCPAEKGGRFHISPHALVRHRLHFAAYSSRSWPLTPPSTSRTNTPPAHCTTLGTRGIHRLQIYDSSPATNSTQPFQTCACGRSAIMPSSPQRLLDSHETSGAHFQA